MDQKFASHVAAMKQIIDNKSLVIEEYAVTLDMAKRQLTMANKKASELEAENQELRNIINDQVDAQVSSGLKLNAMASEIEKLKLANADLVGELAMAKEDGKIYREQAVRKQIKLEYELVQCKLVVKRAQKGQIQNGGEEGAASGSASDVSN
ncbi:unnamed protein product [Orchesella dallaii]|uniref:Uncharacterized protein n=1 Tax=Orchesella dallaii TaxID=48710 RepID=A0ABP1RZ91_9HEXA